MYLPRSEIISKQNDLFEGLLTDDDMVNYALGSGTNSWRTKTLPSKPPAPAKTSSARATSRMRWFDAVIEHMVVNSSMANQMLNNQQTLEGFMRLRVDMVYDGFANKWELADV